MEKIYTDVKRKIAQLSVQESPNPYLDRKNKLQSKYLVQLDKTIKEYPAYKADLENDYNKQLSLLNGISKQLDILQTEVNENTRRLESKIELGDLEIQKLKQTERNLKHSTSMENLDATAKQMLTDHATNYNRQQLLFWIKLGVVLFIVADCIHNKKYELLGSLFGLTLVVWIFYSLYLRYTSRG
jgi:hypothetical protein